MSWKKWECPPDFLTVERKLSSLQLTPQQLDELAMTYYDIELRKAKTPEERAAWATLKVKKQSAIVSKGVNESFVEDFQLWLQGRSKYNKKTLKIAKFKNGKIEYTERECTPWGNKSLLHLEDVREWLKLPLLNRDLVIKEISQLKMCNPLDIGECWEYYKYIVRAVGVDGDAIKEQRNYSEFDYIEKRPIITEGKTDKDSDRRIVPEPDMRFTPLSIENPSMPKFNEEGYKHVYVDCENRARTGDADLLESDEFAALTPEDKLFVASVLSTNVKVDPDLFRYASNNGIGALVDEIASLVDDVVMYDATEGVSKEEEKKNRRDFIKKQKEERAKLQKEKLEEKKRIAQEKKEEKKQRDIEKKREKEETKKEKEEERKRKKEEKQKEKEQKEQAKKKIKEKYGKDIEMKDQAIAQLKALKEKQENTKKTAKRENTEKETQKLLDKRKKETEKIIKAKVAGETKELKIQIANIEKTNRELQELLKAKEIATKKRKKEEEEEDDEDYSSEEAIQRYMKAEGKNIFRGRVIENNQFPESVITDKEYGSVNLSSVFNQALKAIDGSDAESWDVVLLEKYYDKVMTNITKVVSEENGRPVVGLLSAIQDNPPMGYFEDIRRKFTDAFDKSPVLKDIAELYAANDRDTVTHMLRSFVNISISANADDRLDALHSISALLNMSSIKKDFPAKKTMTSLLATLNNPKIIENKIKSGIATDKDEVVNRMIRAVVTPDFVQEKDALQILKGTKLKQYKKSQIEANIAEYINDSQEIEKYSGVNTALDAVDENSQITNRNNEYLKRLGMTQAMIKRAGTDPMDSEILKKVSSQLSGFTLENAQKNKEDANAWIAQNMQISAKTRSEISGIYSEIQTRDAQINELQNQLNIEREKTNLENADENEKQRLEQIERQANEKIQQLNEERERILSHEKGLLFSKYGNILKNYPDAETLGMERDIQKRNDINDFFSSYDELKSKIGDMDITSEFSSEEHPQRLIANNLDRFRQFQSTPKVYIQNLEQDIGAMFNNPKEDIDFSRYSTIQEASPIIELARKTQEKLRESTFVTEQATASKQKLERINRLMAAGINKITDEEYVNGIKQELAATTMEEQGYFAVNPMETAKMNFKILETLRNLQAGNEGAAAELQRLRGELDEKQKQVARFGEPSLNMEESLTYEQKLTKEYSRLYTNMIKLQSNLTKNRLDLNDTDLQNATKNELGSITKLMRGYGIRMADMKYELEEMKRAKEKFVNSGEIDQEGGRSAGDLLNMVSEITKKENMATILDRELKGLWEIGEYYRELLYNSRLHDPTSEADKEGFRQLTSGEDDHTTRALLLKEATSAFENLSEITGDNTLLYSSSKANLNKAKMLLYHVQKRMSPYSNAFTNEERRIYEAINHTFETIDKVASMTKDQKKKTILQAIQDNKEKKIHTEETEDEILEETEDDNETEQQMEIKIDEDTTEIVSGGGAEFFFGSGDEAVQQFQRYSDLLHQKEKTEEEKEEFEKLEAHYKTVGTSPNKEEDSAIPTSSFRKEQDMPKVEKPRKPKNKLAIVKPARPNKEYRFEAALENAIIKKTGNEPSIEVAQLTKAILGPAQESPFVLSAEEMANSELRNTKLEAMKLNEIQEAKEHLQTIKKDIDEITEEINNRRRTKTEAEREEIKEISKELGISEEEATKMFDFLNEETEEEDTKKHAGNKRTTRKDLNRDEVFSMLTMQGTKNDPLEKMISKETKTNYEELINDTNYSRYGQNISRVMEQTQEGDDLRILSEISNTVSARGKEKVKDDFRKFINHGDIHNQFFLETTPDLEIDKRVQVPTDKLAEFEVFLLTGKEKELPKRIQISTTMTKLLGGEIKITNDGNYDFTGKEKQPEEEKLPEVQVYRNFLSFKQIINLAESVGFDAIDEIRGALSSELKLLNYMGEKNKEMSESIQKRESVISPKIEAVRRMREEYLEKISSYEGLAGYVSVLPSDTIQHTKLDIGKFFRSLTLDLMYDTIEYKNQLLKIAKVSGLDAPQNKRFAVKSGNEMAAVRPRERQRGILKRKQYDF